MNYFFISECEFNYFQQIYLSLDFKNTENYAYVASGSTESEFWISERAKPGRSLLILRPVVYLSTVHFRSHTSSDGLLIHFQLLSQIVNWSLMEDTGREPSSGQDSRV